MNTLIHTCGKRYPQKRAQFTNAQLSQNHPKNLGHHPCPNLSHTPLGHPLTCENTTHHHCPTKTKLGHHHHPCNSNEKTLSQLSLPTGVGGLRPNTTHPPLGRAPQPTAHTHRSRS